MNRDAAVCLYAALVCDTGRFQYESTTPAVFELARELSCFDVPIPELSRTLFEEHRFAYLQLLAEALQNAVLVPEKQFVWTKVSQVDLECHDVSFDEVEGLTDVLRRSDHEIRIHHARHRRENDRKFGLEKLEKSAVGPHGLLIHE